MMMTHLNFHVSPNVPILIQYTVGIVEGFCMATRFLLKFSLLNRIGLLLVFVAVSCQQYNSIIASQHLSSAVQTPSLLVAETVNYLSLDSESQQMKFLPLHVNGRR